MNAIMIFIVFVSVVSQSLKHQLPHLVVDSALVVVFLFFPAFKSRTLRLVRDGRNQVDLRNGLGTP